ncbi:cache domain-containing protein [Desulfobulbus propionicus]|jgi:PAS domain S-box-containing protein/putative nucleotidyltransferase with HDIG domain
MPEKKRIYTISRRIALPALLTIVLFVTSIFFIILPQLEKSFIARKQEMIREQTETTWSLLTDYHNRELSGELTTGEAQLRALLRIGKLRYGPEKKDYFWINDMIPRMLMHPYRPDLLNKDVTDFKDPRGKRLFFEMVQLAKREGAGYVDYMWQWKDDPTKIVQKISFVKKFSPWGWVIGTGVYIDDVQAEIAIIRKRLSAISTAILFVAVLLALYSIHQSIKADREREHLLKSLKKSTERFRNLVETTSDWVWETDKIGRITYSSPQVTELLGYPVEEITGNFLLHLASPNQKTILGPLFKGILAAKNPFKGFEMTCFGKNGQIVVFENNGVPVFDDQGELTGYRGVARDMTERKIATETLKKSRDELRASLEETVKSLASTVEKRDPYIASHQQRVDLLACAIARELGLPEERIEGVHIAALLHDIGMIALPSEYLTKPSKLSNEEKAIMKCHPEFGYQILRNIQFPWPVAEIVYQHHELLDGSGYPRGLHDQEIHLEAKIIAVADVVESMISHRPYRPSLGITKALEEIQAGRNIRYHAASVDACTRLILEKKLKFFSEVEDENLG